MMRVPCLLWICFLLALPSLSISRPIEKEDKAPTEPNKTLRKDEPARKNLNYRPGDEVFDEGPYSVPQDKRTFDHKTGAGKVNTADSHDPALPAKRTFNYGTGIGHWTHDDEEQYLNDLEELLDSFGHILIDVS